ncbi:MAG: Holliday junction branch migration protein RuvA [Firmicutes bacterium]|nr:Holliday junction branch migration protein RuvA [Bacillota bacterium]
MFNYIKGQITDIQENYLVIETGGGVGYELNCSHHTLTALKISNEHNKIFVHYSQSEAGVFLYGFHSKEEKAMFLRLISISGIGPKAAITVLSGVAPNELAMIILRSDIEGLVKIKGVGKKTAERIILELKDKVHAEFKSAPLILDNIANTLPSDANKDAVLALMSMGYSKNEATEAVGRVNCAGKALDQIIIEALKQ